jgi:hypothetical protein
MIRKRLFYDIETSYYIVKAWRPGYNLNIGPHQVIKFPAIICVSYKWEGEDKVNSLRWDDNQDDKTLLEKFIPILDKANQIVAHHGDSFDLKWLRMRAIKQGLIMKPRYETIDTKKLAKSQFNFHSNKLDELGRFFDLGRKNDTDMELWDKIILNKDPEALDYMVEYCEQDVRLLEQVYHKLRPYTQAKFNYGKLYGDDNWACPECGKLTPHINKSYTTPMGVRRYYLRCSDKECRQQYPISYLTYRNMIKWRTKNGI